MKYIVTTPPQGYSNGMTVPKAVEHEIDATYFSIEDGVLLLVKNKKTIAAFSSWVSVVKQ